MLPSDKFIFTSDEVFYMEISCKICDTHLFNSGDILFQTRLFNRIFLFTENSVVADCIEIFGVSGVRCKTCHNGLGGMVYRDWTTRNHLVRFSNQALEQNHILLWKRE